MIKKILITGCGGMLGSSVYRHLIEKKYDVLATDIDLDESWLSYLDVRDFEKAREISSKFRPDLIINLAALTSLEYCNSNLENAHSTNFLGAKNMAQISKELNIPIVHVSTAGVFDGEKEKYFEEDVPNPLNVYGMTKLCGEVSVESMLDKYFVVRAGWMVGGGKKDKKFVSYMLSQIKGGNTSFKVVDDKFGTMTYTKDFAENLEKLFNTKHYGKYHMACSGNTSRYEIMKEILNVLKIEDSEIKPVPSKYFEKDFPIPRAKNEKMENKNLKKIGMDFMGDWQSSLKHYLENEWSELLK